MTAEISFQFFKVNLTTWFSMKSLKEQLQYLPDCLPACLVANSVTSWPLISLFMTFLTTSPFFSLLFHSDFSPCQSSPCIRGGKCNVESDAYSCDCLPFYSGRNCDGKYKTRHFSLNRAKVAPGRASGELERKWKECGREIFSAFNQTQN